jgi:DNA integrity scanning protein DisA with diadenylate cyclase activity
MGENPEAIADEYEDREMILVYPKNRRPTVNFLLKKNVKNVFSDYSFFPDVEALCIIRDTIMYLINASYVNSSDRVLFIFEKTGERHELFFDMSKLRLLTLLDTLSDRLDRRVVESVLKLSMAIVKKGREGSPVGALFIVGDARNVMKNVVQKIANPMNGIELEKRNVLLEDNFDTLREFAIMDGATVLDENGYVVSSGVYVKNLVVDEWILNGHGGRHLAARSITKLTKAISFAVSSEGTIRVYKDGKMIYELNNF